MECIVSLGSRSEDISITSEDYLIPYMLTNFEEVAFLISGKGGSMTVKSVLLLSME
jgi:hypothetical protein